MLRSRGGAQKRICGPSSAVDATMGEHAPLFVMHLLCDVIGADVGYASPGQHQAILDESYGKHQSHWNGWVASS
eukprot:3012979-Rhodomonas_salina.2